MTPEHTAISLSPERLKAVFVVRSDSDIRDFDELRGTTLSAPPKQAAVSLLAQETLLKHGLMPGSAIHSTYQHNHAACLRAVLIRKAAACITAPAPLEVFSARSGLNFRVPGPSDPVPASAFQPSSVLFSDTKARPGPVARRAAVPHSTSPCTARAADQTPNPAGPMQQSAVGQPGQAASFPVN